MIITCDEKIMLIKIVSEKVLSHINFEKLKKAVIYLEIKNIKKICI